MNGFINDLRFGLRQIIAKPGFASAAILTLALGIGANTAVFSVLNGYLLKPLPYPQGDQLVAINESFLSEHQPYVGVSAMNYLDIKKHASTLAEVALYKRSAFNLTTGGETERVTGLRARGTLFDMLRVKPYLGQVFGRAADRQGRDQVVVLSYGLWQKMFGGDASIVGNDIKLDGQPHRIVAVMPKNFEFPDARTDLWVPFPFAEWQLHKCRLCEHDQQMIARARPGIGLDAVRAQLQKVESDIVHGLPPQFQHAIHKMGWGIRIRSYRDKLLADRMGLLLILQGFVLLLLVMTCVNVANLLLARILGRAHEFAMRAALGASRLKLIRQLLVEALCLALPGGAVGIGLSWLGLSLIRNVGLSAHLGVFSLGPDWRVALFALLLVVLVAFVISVLPVRQLSRGDLQGLLQESGGAAGGSHGVKHMRGALVVAEIALAAALLGGTGLLLNSFLRLQSVNPGFDSRGVLSADLLMTGNADVGGRISYYGQLLRGVQALPGVKEAGLVSAVPIKTAPIGNAYHVPGLSPPGGHPPVGNYNVASRGYFKALDIGLLRGRLFGPQDTPQSQPVIIVDKKLADRWFPNESPIGHQMTLGGDSTRYTIVGEVASVHPASLDRPPQRGTYYLSARQNPYGDLSLVIKTSVPPYSLVRPIRKLVHDLKPMVSVSNFTSMDDVLAKSLAEREALMVLVLIFACIGLALAAVGVYGVLNYVVNQRVTECGVRLALGALPSDLLWLIIRDGLRLLVIGLCIGLGLAVVLGYTIASQLFNVAPFDPVTLVGVVVALSVITLAACYLPARRASKLDPAVAILEQ